MTDLRTTAMIPGQRGAPVGLLEDAGDPFVRLESSREFAVAILATRFVKLSADVHASSRSEDYSVMVDDIEVLVCPAFGPCSPFATSGEVAPRRCTAPATSRASEMSIWGGGHSDRRDSAPSFGVDKSLRRWQVMAQLSDVSAERFAVAVRCCRCGGDMTHDQRRGVHRGWRPGAARRSSPACNG